MKHFEFLHDDGGEWPARPRDTGMVLRGLDLADEQACSAMRTALAAALEHQVRFVVLDASRVTDLDRQTVTSLAMVGARLRSRGGALVVTHASPRVVTLLRTFDAEELLQVVATDAVRRTARAVLTAAPAVPRDVPAPRAEWVASAPPSASVA